MWVPPEEIERARQIDLLTYFKNYEPDQLVKVGRNTYSTKEHDSMRISNGLWHWTSRRIGGNTALDFFVFVRGMTLPKATEYLLGEIHKKAPLPVEQPNNDIREFALPDRNEGNENVYSYLKNRGIDKRIIEYCINTKRLYEDKNFHNVVFVGFNENKEPKFASLRSTFTDFKRDISGSDKRFSFLVPGNENKKTVHLFESVIDLLSYGTFEIMKNKNWRAEDLLSLGGVYILKDNSDLPLPLTQYLKTNEVKNIVLHFDNDEIGISAAETLKDRLKDKFNIFIDIPTKGKDLNEQLILTMKRRELER